MIQSEKKKSTTKFKTTSAEQKMKYGLSAQNGIRAGFVPVYDSTAERLLVCIVQKP